MNETQLTPQVIRTEQNIEATERRTVLATTFTGSLRGATPSVKNLEIFIAKNVAPVTVTNFLDGQDSQTITILGDANMTVQHGTKIFTNTGANKLLAANKIYRFTRLNAKWYEDA